MNARTRLALVVAAIAGYAAFALLFSRFDRVATAGYRLDSPSAIAAARDAAQRFDIDARSFRASINHRADEGAIRRTHGADPAKLPGELSGLGARVRLASPAVEVVTELDGRSGLIGVSVRRSALQPSVSDVAVLPLATAWLDKLTCGESDRYRVAERSSEKGVAHVVWTRIDDPARRAEAFVSSATQPTVRLFAAALPKDRPWRTVETSSTFLWGALLVAIVLTAIAAGVLALGRRQARLRWAAAAAVPMLVVYAAEILLTPLRFPSPWDAESQGQAARVMQLVLLVGVLPLFRAAVCGLAWAAGRAAMLPSRAAATHAVDRLLAARITDKGTGRALLAGLAVAGLVAAMPLLAVAASAGGLAGTAAIDGRGQILFARLPLLALVANAARSALWDVLPLFGCVVPLLDESRRRRLAVAAAVIGGAAWLGELALYGPGEGLAGLIVGALIGALWLFLYRRFGLVAVLASSFAAEALRTVGMLAVRPDLSSRMTAAGGIAVIGAAAVIAELARRKGLEEATAPSVQQRMAAPVASSDRLRAEMELARSMQERLMGRAQESVEGFEISSTCRAAKEVGGDLYAVLPLRGGHKYALALTVADVAGKGLPAALTMTLTKGLLLGAAEESSDVREIAAILNEGVRLSRDRRTFVTAVIVALDTQTRRCTVVRAGHTPVMLLRAGAAEVEELSPAGLALGMAASSVFTRSLVAIEVDLSPGDALVLYSDGVTEAMNPDDDQFGETRLADVLKRHRTATAAELQLAIAEEVDRFRDGAAPNDDMTIAVVRAV